MKNFKNTIATTAATAGLTPILAVGSEIVFDFAVIPSAMYRPEIALAGLACTFMALVAKASFWKMQAHQDPIERLIQNAY